MPGEDTDETEPDPDRTEAVRRYAAFDRERHAGVYDALADEEGDADGGGDRETHGDLTERRRDPDMTDPAPLLSRVVVPVAGPEDAAATAEAVLPRVARAEGHVTAVYVVEKAGGAPDKAGVEQREAHAEAAFDVLESRAGTLALGFDSRVAYGTDVVGTVLEVAHEVGATALAFTPRGRNFLADLITGDLGADFVDRADLPVLAVPAADEGSMATGDDA